MKIATAGSIPLDGPLSRNSRILSLKPGDTVRVNVLEWTSSTSAMIDIKGNKVHASFSVPVPQSPQLNLILKNITPQSLQFELKGEARPDLKSYISSLTGMEMKSISPEQMRDVIFASRSGTAGIFTVMLRLAGYSDVRAKNIKKLAGKLNAAGHLSGGFSTVSALLSGMSMEECDQILKMLRFLPGIHNGADGRAGSRADEFCNFSCMDDEEHFAEFFNDMNNAGDASQCGCIVFPVSEGFISVKTVSGSDMYAGLIETPSAGTFEFLLRGSGDNCSAVISCGESAYSMVSAHAGELYEQLSMRYEKISLSVMRSSEIQEKILALSESFLHNSLNVIV